MCPKVVSAYKTYLADKGLANEAPFPDIGLSFADTDPESSDSELGDLVSTA